MSNKEIDNTGAYDQSDMDLEKFALRKYNLFNVCYDTKKMKTKCMFQAMTMKKITHRTSKGPIAITRIDPKGDFIVLENTCIKKVFWPILLNSRTHLAIPGPISSMIMIQGP
jgi:hypothetical protein